MKKFLVIALTVAIGSLCFINPASALMINFEDNAVAVGANVILSNDVVSNGYTFDYFTDHGHLANASFGADNGSTYLVIDDYYGTNPTTMFESVTGAAFSLNSMDLSEWDNSSAGSAATAVTFTGNYAGGGSVTTTVQLDGIWDGTGPLADFQAISFDASWANLASVVMQGSGSSSGYDYYAIDNITVNDNAIPEPTTMLLFGSGLIGLVGLRKKNK